MKVVFMGSPDFSVPVLDGLMAEHEVVAVYCQPPRPAGRGKADRVTPVHARAQALGLPVFHPAHLRDIDTQQAFHDLQADVAVVVAYGLLLPKPILESPRLGCLNIHASLLPRWRGAAPIHRAIMAGDDMTGICIMQMDQGLDTGPVLARQAVTIGPEETTQSLHDRLSTLGAALLCRTLADLPVKAEPQTAEGITYAAKIDKAETRIDWTRPATEVDRHIRGLSAFPGAWCLVAGERVKCLQSRLGSGSGPAGRVIARGKDHFTVACGLGAVEIVTAQREGKKALPVQDLILGWALPDMID